MKQIRLLLFIVLLTISFGSKAQWISSLSVTPAHPTDADTIYLLANCSFGSGTCNPFNPYHTVADSNIYAGAIHCLGMLTYICGYTDTFKVNPLPAGTYHFIYQLNSGEGPSPCTPGIVPGPSDTLSFTVSRSTGVPERFMANNELTIYPNPSEGRINFSLYKQPTLSNKIHAEVFSVTGEKQNEYFLSEKNTTVEMNLLAGVYLCKLSNAGSIEYKRLVIIK